MPPLVCVKWTDADEAMHAAFALQIAVSIIADDTQGSAADACFLVAQLVDQLRLKAVTLRPARIKAQEHLRPVAGFGSAGAGLNLKESVAGVLRAAEHGPQFKIIESALGAVELRLQLDVKAAILLG